MTNWFCSFIRNAADSEINETNLIVKIKSRMHEMAFYFSGKGSDLCGKLPVIFLSTIQSHKLPMFISLFCGCNKLINLIQIDNYKKLIHLWINLSWWNIHTKLIIRSMITLEILCLIASLCIASYGYFWGSFSVNLWIFIIINIINNSFCRCVSIIIIFSITIIITHTILRTILN